MDSQFIRIRNRVINVAAISYVRLYDDPGALTFGFSGRTTTWR